jgi:hypothetical protein
MAIRHCTRSRWQTHARPDRYPLNYLAYVPHLAHLPKGTAVCRCVGIPILRHPTGPH